MGSFNETCALSNLNISYGTPVRVLFLTQNPYVTSDGHEAQRGCYHYDNWFVRTPPLKGKYDDYGRAALAKSKLPKLIADVFSTDVVERPFGFNQYHEPAVFRGQNLAHYLQAAWEGRLLVHDDYREPKNPLPESWPTWGRVTEILKKAKLPIQKKEDSKAYNVQAVIPGVVCVHFNSYDDATNKLEIAKKFLADYDCKVLSKFEDGGEKCLIVATKGAFENPSLLAQVDKILESFTVYPRANSQPKNLSVLSVMVREDVWQAFCNIPLTFPSWQSERKSSVDDLKAVLSGKYDNALKAQKMLKGGDTKGNVLRIFDVLGEAAYREVIHSLPFQTGPGKHLVYASENEFEAKDELIQAVAELVRVECIMSALHRPWYIPPLGGQEGGWKLHTQLLSEIHAISKKELEREESESAD
jgi:hypothetical protein